MGKNNKKTKRTRPKNTDQQTLPAKQAALFKQVARCYEQKQHKKALKHCDQILKKFPENGETLAMKGLVLNGLDRRAEGEELIRQGLRKNIKSHVCWHVFGLFHRSERDYNEAIKSYLNALKIDTDNLQIMKDLASLQIHLRQFEGFNETRRKILVLKSANRNNWIAYAISNHLAGNYDSAQHVLESYQNTLGGNFDANYEISEMLLYRNQIIEESGELDRCLEHLDEIEDKIVDRISWLEKKAKVSKKLGHFDQAALYYNKLMEINSNNWDYYKELMSCNLRDEEDSATQVAFMNEMKERFPKSNAVKRIPLQMCSLDCFQELLDDYLRYGLRKGIPSLFQDIRPLYAYSGRGDIIETTLVQFLDNLRSQLRFSDSDEENNEAPSVFLWTLMILAQHFDHYRQNQVYALELINEAIEHTPTAIELYMAKSKIYKHAGDVKAAFKWIDEARRLDLADRYLNTKAVKYAFAAGYTVEAEALASLFLRDGDYMLSMYEMQASWYEHAQALCFRNLNNLGKALKKLTAIQNHFNDIHEDQFDFHVYCLRKMTLRAYVDMLRWEDTLRSHKSFRKATSEIVSIYLEIHRRIQTGIPIAEETAPKEGDVIMTEGASKQDEDQENIDLSKLGAKERRRIKNKLRKKKKESEKNKDGTDSSGTTKPKNESRRSADARKHETLDPDGRLLLEQDPLSAATKHLRMLEADCMQWVSVEILAFRVYFEREKWLLCLRALNRAERFLSKTGVDGDEAELFYLKVQFALRVMQELSELKPFTAEILEAEVTKMFPNGVSIACRDFEAEVSSPNQCFALCRALLLTRGVDAHSDIIAKSLELFDFPQRDLKTSIATYKFLKNDLKDEDAAQQYFDRAHEVYPLSTVFRSAASIEETVEGQNLVEDDEKAA